MAAVPAPPHKPHPYLTAPVLFCSGFPSSTANEDLVDALRECLKCRLALSRSEDPTAPASGKIEFESLEKAELALATVNGQRLPGGGVLDLSFSPTSPPSPPSSTPRLIKQLPFTLTPSELFALCRPYGPIHSLTLLLAPPPPHAPPGSLPKFRGHATVAYYAEDDAQAMQEALHFAEVGGQNVAVSVWDEKRAERNRARRSDVSAGTPQRSPAQQQGAFEQQQQHSPSVSPSLGRTSRWAAEQGGASPSPSTPAAGASKYAGLSAGAQSFAPQSAGMGRTVSGTSQWSVASSGAGEAKEKRDGVDPCNLFIKSLPPSLLSSHLHALFSPYGPIISARVMTDPSTSLSREFGFVSFRDESSASAALAAVDGSWVGVDASGEVVRGEACRMEGVEARRVKVSVHEKKEVRARRSEASAVDDIEKGVASLSASTSSSRYAPALAPSGAVAPAPASPVAPQTPKQNSPSASRWASPSTAAASPSPVAPVAAAEEPVEIPKLSERQRLVEAVRKVKGTEGRVEELVALLDSLPKKERALCLFNPAVLAQKVTDALAILEDDDDDAPTAAPPAAALTTSTASPTFAAAPAPAPTQSLPALLPHPCSTLLPLLRSTPPPGIPLEDTSATREAQQFMDTLEGQPVSVVKQKLGERVFKSLKREGVKGAPRITIHLLDTEPDLRALAELAAGWPAVLKAKGEKVAEELKGK
ncbi:hypothetical protein JCM10213_006135 [Rhodosporidiobolus nylandii]